MPNYKLVSAKEILARVIRALGYKLPSVYQDDILEWIPEGMSFMELTNSLVVASTGEEDEENELLVTNHCAPLPCGFVNILAVEDGNGNRIGTAQAGFGFKQLPSELHIPRPSVFEVNPYLHQTSDGVPTTQPGTSVPLYGEDIIPRDTNAGKPKYYNIQGNHIQTSFECGFIRLHYLAIPVDKEGYPLIPDNENFKQALEWHIIRRLIGSGYDHKVFKYDFADAQFEKFAARAMNEISFASEDDRRRSFMVNIRLIPPTGYADQFVLSDISNIIHR